MPLRTAPAAALFPNAPRSVRVFNRDLVAAGLAAKDDDGTIHKADSRGRTLDMHSLRGTYASMLAVAGVPLATTQVLMRHSTPALTAKHYVDPAMLDTAGAVERLPGLHPEQDAARKVENTPGKCPPMRPPLYDKTGQNVAFPGPQAGQRAPDTPP
ncbi:MAG: hypothetical protein ACLFTT_16555 [Candidatus Hydrogenedentota bacterium]